MARKVKLDETLDEIYEEINGTIDIDERDMNLSDVEEVSVDEMEQDYKEECAKEEGAYTTDSVLSYVKEMHRYPLLSAEEVTALCNKGDDESKNKIICSNLRLAFHIAKKYTNRGVSLLDLIQEANIGLVKAVDGYKPEMGYKFSTYATWWCTAHVRRCIQENNSTLRLPIYIVEQITKIRNAQQQFEYANIEYTDEDLAKATGLKLSEVKNALDAQNKSEMLSLDYETGDDKGNTLNETLVDTDENVEDNFITDERNRHIRELISRFCDEREADIIVRHFGLVGQKETFDDLALSYGVSKQRIGQLYKRALSKLPTPASKKLFTLLVE